MSRRKSTLRTVVWRPGLWAGTTLVAMAALVIAAATTMPGCQTLELPGADGGAAITVTIEPNTVKLKVTNDKIQAQKFRAYAVIPEGFGTDLGRDRGKGSGGPAGSVEVTDRVTWSVDNTAIGRFEGNEFRTEVEENGTKRVSRHGGQAQIKATLEGGYGVATVSVTFTKTFWSGGAPQDAAKKFAGKKQGTVAVYYPPNPLIVPPNLGQMEFQFSKGGNGNNDLFKLVFSGAMGAVTIYSSSNNTNLTVNQWKAIGMTNAGLDVTYRIYATQKKGGQPVAQSVARTLKMADTPVKGGLYYWVLSLAKAGEKPKYGSIYRYDFNNLTEKPEAYYTQQEAKDCVGCHSLSRGGEKIAFTFTGGNGDAAIFNVNDKAAVHKPGTYKADIQTFNPAGTEVIVVNQGKLYRREVKTGKVLEVMDAGTGKATHPDWSPDGDSLVFVKVADKDYYASGLRDDVHFRNGSIAIMSRSSGRWSTPKVLKAGGNGVNFYYPTFSPGNDWILFNRSTGDSYSDPDANIYIIKPDGKGFRALDRINKLNLSNSWPRWSPFKQRYRGSSKYYWFTFSSVRDYGVRLKNSKILNYDYKIPQIWMTFFDVDKAEKGQDPSSLPFWIPFQDITHHNHIAQWTEKVVSQIE